MRSVSRSLLASLVICLAAASSIVATGKRPAVGARAIAMGGAFAAVTSDASAVYWNPAALASLQRQELAFTHADRYGLGLNTSYLAYSLPLADNHALGLDWHHQGFGDSELDYHKHAFALAYGYRNGVSRLRRYLGNCAVGVSARYISQDVDLDSRALMSAGGWGWDAGITVPLPFGAMLGLMVQDVGGTSLEHGTGLNETVFAASYRAGLSCQPVEGVTVAGGLDDEIRLGAEYWVRGVLALRAGMHSELDTPESFADATSASFGFGIKYRFAQFDYAYEHHPVLEPTHYTAMSLAYNPAVVSIKGATIKPSPVFRSLYRYYEETDFVDVVLGNSAQEPVEATVGISVPRVMKTPHLETVVLPPQSKAKYAFGITFDHHMFNQPEASYDHFVIPEVEVVYSRNRQERKVVKQLDRVYVAGKGKLSWNVPGMAAAFVTPEDLAVAGLARGLVQRYDELLAAKFDRSNLGKAVLIFDAMGAYRIRYQADQNTPFTSIADDKTIFDTVQYPTELLAKPEGVETKVGDCDDLTVLYASLLGNLSIDTVFLEANEPGKGHIYLMFDSGLGPGHVEDHFVRSTEFVEWQGRIWIPVETTMFGFTFADAWRNGAGEYHRLKARGLIDEMSVQRWMQKYKPASLPPARAEVPHNAMLDSLLERDMIFFDQRVERIALGAVTSLNTPEGAYDAGAAYLRLNHLEKALAMFDRVLEMDPDHADAFNGRGVALTRQGEFHEALEQYRQALRRQDSNGIRMNMALTYYVMGERQTADRLFQKVAAADEMYMELFDFLATVGEAQDSYDIGVSYLRQKRLDAAQEHLKEALGADPQYADAVNAMGVLLTYRGQYEEALGHFERAVALEPERLGFQLNVALVHYLMGERDEADVLYQQVIAQDSSYEGLLDFLAQTDSASENYRLAVAYMRQGEYERALGRLDRALQLDPEMGDAYNARGVVLVHMGKYDEAFAMFEVADALVPSQPGIRLNMAIVRYLQGRTNEAAAIYQQLVRVAPRYEGFLDFLEVKDDPAGTGR